MFAGKDEYPIVPKGVVVVGVAAVVDVVVVAIGFEVVGTATGAGAWLGATVVTGDTARDVAVTLWLLGLAF